MEAAKNFSDDTMQSKPLVSVIMPVYNSEKYLISAIRSVLEQTYDNFELICVDDGSTDLSPEILRLQQPDSHLKIITQKNQGPSAARNAGLDVAQGDYIAFVDSDDYIELDTLDILVKTALETEAEIVVFGGSTFPVEIPTPAWIEKKLSPSVKVYEGKFAGINALLREESSKPFMWLHFVNSKLINGENKVRLDTSLDIGEDQLAIFSYFPKANKVVFISDKLYHYRINHTNSIMSKYDAMRATKFQKHIEVVTKILQHWKKYDYRDKTGDLTAYLIGFLYYDWILFPEYKKINYSKSIVALFANNDWDMRLCKEWAYDLALEIINYSQKEPLSSIEEIQALQEEVSRIKIEIDKTLASKKYRYGKMITPKKKRIQEKDFLLYEQKRIF